MKYIIKAWAAKMQSKEYESDAQDTLPLAFADIMRKIKFDEDFNEGVRFCGSLIEIKDDDLDEHNFIRHILLELRREDRKSVEDGICEMELKELNSMLVKWIRNYCRDSGIVLSPFINERYCAISLVKTKERAVVTIDNKYWGQV